MMVAQIAYIEVGDTIKTNYLMLKGQTSENKKKVDSKTFLIEINNRLEKLTK